MSACLHYKINADIEKLQLRTNADIAIPHKIRLFVCNVCMSALYILYIINFFILIYILLAILNFSLYTIKNTSYKIKKVYFGADIADMQTCRHKYFICNFYLYFCKNIL